MPLPLSKILDSLWIFFSPEVADIQRNCSVLQCHDGPRFCVFPLPLSILAPRQSPGSVCELVTLSIWLNWDAPREGPRQLPNNHPAASGEEPRSFVRSESCKAPFPCPKCLFPALRQLGEHLGQVTRSGPVQSRQRSLPPQRPAAAARENKGKGKKRKRETHSLRLIPSTDLP